MPVLNPRKIIKLSLIIFIVWISFVPELIQIQYKIPLNLLLGIILIFSLARQHFNFREVFLNPATAIFSAYLLLLLPGVFFSAQPRAALSFYKDLALSAALVFFIFRGLAKSEDCQEIIYCLVVCAGIVSFLGMLEMFFKTNPIYLLLVDNPYYSRFIGKRMMSTLVHPNIVGAYLIACVPLASYFYRSARNDKLKLLNLAFFCLIISGIILSFSRGTWIACLLMCSFWLWQKGKNKWIIYLWLTSFVFSAVCATSIFGANFAKRFGIIRLLYYVRFSHRAKNYIITWEALKEHPFVGIGLNCYREFTAYFSRFRLTPEVRVPDSIYLMHLAETGLIGFLGLALLLGYILKKAWRNRQSALFLGFLGLLINMASFDGFLWQTPFYLFWIYLALLSATTESKDGPWAKEK
ncbi:MAG: O-antigen ligase family protein [Candidatus Omnitrophica bacterium]|nr:O-antigen ligase family protein [Candidatus Omnitrophota bacterium]